MIVFDASIPFARSKLKFPEVCPTQLPLDKSVAIAFFSSIELNVLLHGEYIKYRP